MGFLSCDNHKVTINQKVCWNVSNFNVVPESDNAFKTGANNGRLKRPYDKIKERLVVTIEFTKLNKEQFDSLYAEVVSGEAFTVQFDSGIALPFLFDQHTTTQLYPKKDGYVFGFIAKSVNSFESPFIGRALGKPITHGCNQDYDDPCCYDIVYNNDVQNYILGATASPIVTRIFKNKEWGDFCGGMQILSPFATLGFEEDTEPFYGDFGIEIDPYLPDGVYEVQVLIWNSCKTIETTINVTVLPPPIFPKTITYDASASTAGYVENKYNPAGTTVKTWILEDPNNTLNTITALDFRVEDILGTTNDSASLSLYAWAGSSYIFQAQWVSSSGVPILIDTSNPPITGAIQYNSSKYMFVLNITSVAPNHPILQVDISGTSANLPNPKLYTTLITS